MKTEVFRVGTLFKSDTYYTFDTSSELISVSDTIRTEEKKYLSTDGESNFGFLNIAFYLHGLKNVTLDFGGAVVTFCGRIQPFIIDECENIIIKNVTIKYDRAFFTEFDIVSNAEGELRLKPLKEFPCRVEDGELIPYAESWEDSNLNQRAHWLQVFDKKTHEGRGFAVVMIGKENKNAEPHPSVVPNQLAVRSEDGLIVLSGNIPSEWDDSMRVCLVHEIRDKSGAALYGSKNIQIENFRILNGSGMGFLAVYTENISLHKVYFYSDSLSDGIITNGADGVHFVSCYGKISITDSIFEGMIDDALNIHSNFYHADKAWQNTFIADSRKTHAYNGAFQVFAPGDMIAVYCGDTFEEKERYTIKSMRQLDQNHMEFETEKSTVHINAGDMIENISAYPELRISGCRFGKANSHLRIQTKGKTIIENCETSLPIWLTGDTHVWYEAGNSTDITITGCQFTGEDGRIEIIPECNLTESCPYYHSGIKILNNIFESSKALTARDADGVLFCKNKLRSEKNFDLNIKNCKNLQYSMETDD